MLCVHTCVEGVYACSSDAPEGCHCLRETYGIQVASSASEPAATAQDSTFASAFSEASSSTSGSPQCSSCSSGCCGIVPWPQLVRKGAARTCITTSHRTLVAASIYVRVDIQAFWARLPCGVFHSVSPSSVYSAACCSALESVLGEGPEERVCRPIKAVRADLVLLSTAGSC